MSLEWIGLHSNPKDKKTLAVTAKKRTLYNNKKDSSIWFCSKHRNWGGEISKDAGDGKVTGMKIVNNTFTANSVEVTYSRALNQT